jgi:hypothetical protein
VAKSRTIAPQQRKGQGHGGGEHATVRETNAILTYRKAGSRRAVQLLLGHTQIASRIRHIGIEIDDATEIAEKIDV